MSSVASTAGTEEWTTEGTVVAAVDLAVVVGLILVGQMSHPGSLVGDPLGTLETIVPFAVGWVIAVVLAAPYRSSTLASPVSSVRSVSLCWLAAANVGLILRSSPAFDGGVAWAFPLVITGFGLLAFVAWRLVLAAVLGRQSTARS